MHGPVPNARKKRAKEARATSGTIADSVMMRDIKVSVTRIWTTMAKRRALSKHMQHRAAFHIIITGRFSTDKSMLIPVFSLCFA